MFSVRFHLGRGPNFKQWQVKDLKNKDVQVEYFDPYRYQLVLQDCELICNEKTANRVYARGVKDVCGWIKCRDVYVSDPDSLTLPDTDFLPRIIFNPIVDPNWRLQGYPNENWNGRKVDEIITSGNRCYLSSEALIDGV